ncbi:MAG: GAF and ANTAR domain-containing protein [Pseudonocardiaceae bacterium]
MTSTTPERERGLADAFVSLADTLVADYDVIDLLYRLVETCTRLLAADTAGILLSNGRGRLQVMAYSTEGTRLLELLQLQTDEGPCLDCINTGLPVCVPNLTDSVSVSRWPQFAPSATKEGVYSVHALPMRLRSETIGGLNMFSAQPGPLPRDDLRVAQALADVATIGILQERAIHRSEVLTEQLQTALNSRIVIEQAKGVLVERTGLDFADAFALLRSHARAHGVRLSEVARQIVDGSMTTDDLQGDAGRIGGRDQTSSHG